MARIMQDLKKARSEVERIMSDDYVPREKTEQTAWKIGLPSMVFAGILFGCVALAIFALFIQVVLEKIREVL